MLAPPPLPSQAFLKSNFCDSIILNVVWEPSFAWSFPYNVAFLDQVKNIPVAQSSTPIEICGYSVIQSDQTFKNTDKQRLLTTYYFIEKLIF